MNSFLLMNTQTENFEKLIRRHGSIDKVNSITLQRIQIQYYLVQVHLHRIEIIRMLS